MKNRRLSIAIACLAVLAVPSGALAATKVVPPGNSGASQYYETVPSARGNTPPPQIPPAAIRHPSAGEVALARLGKQGQAAAALAAAGAPTHAGGGGSAAHGVHGGGSGPRAGANVSVPPGNGAVHSIADAVTGSGAGGLGLALPILLAAVLAAALGFAVGRRMRRDLA